MVLLDRVVLSRVRVLSADVRTIRPGSDVGARVRVSGRDELASLATEINHMIEALEDSQDEVTRQYEEARRLADLEPLTGLLNHRAFFRRAEEDMVHNQRSGDGFSLVMMDLDDFKLFNDVYGHQTGDDVLRQVGDLLRENARAIDSIARYGGDEFVALLPGTDRSGATAFAERVRDALTTRFRFDAEHAAVPIYMSFGLATFPEDGQDIDRAARSRRRQPLRRETTRERGRHHRVRAVGRQRGYGQRAERCSRVWSGRSTGRTTTRGGTPRK